MCRWRGRGRKRKKSRRERRRNSNGRQVRGKGTALGGGTYEEDEAGAALGTVLEVGTAVRTEGGVEEEQEAKRGKLLFQQLAALSWRVFAYFHKFI